MPSSSSSSSGSTPSSRDNEFKAAMKVGKKVAKSFDSLFEQAGLMDDASTPSGSSTSGSSSTSETARRSLPSGLRMPPMDSFRIPHPNDSSTLGSRSSSSVSAAKQNKNTLLPPQQGDLAPDVKSLSSGSSYSSDSRSSASSTTPSQKIQVMQQAKPPPPRPPPNANSSSSSSGSSDSSSSAPRPRENLRSSPQNNKVTQSIHKALVPPAEEADSIHSDSSHTSGSRTSKSSQSVRKPQTNSLQKINQPPPPPPPPQLRSQKSPNSSNGGSGSGSGSGSSGGSSGSGSTTSRKIISNNKPNIDNTATSTSAPGTIHHAPSSPRSLASGSIRSGSRSNSSSRSDSTSKSSSFHSAKQSIHSRNTATPEDTVGGAQQGTGGPVPTASPSVSNHRSVHSSGQTSSGSNSQEASKPMTIMQRMEARRKALAAKKGSPNPSSSTDSRSSSTSSRQLQQIKQKADESSKSSSSSSSFTPSAGQNNNIWMPPVLDLTTPDTLLGNSSSGSGSSSSNAKNDIWVPPPLDIPQQGNQSSPQQSKSPSSSSGSSSRRSSESNDISIPLPSDDQIPRGTLSSADRSNPGSSGWSSRNSSTSTSEGHNSNELLFSQASEIFDAKKSDAKSSPSKLSPQGSPSPKNQILTTTSMNVQSTTGENIHKKVSTSPASSNSSKSVGKHGSLLPSSIALQKHNHSEKTQQRSSGSPSNHSESSSRSTSTSQSPPQSNIQVRTLPASNVQQPATESSQIERNAKSPTSESSPRSDTKDKKIWTPPTINFQQYNAPDNTEEAKSALSQDGSRSGSGSSSKSPDRAKNQIWTPPALNLQISTEDNSSSRNSGSSPSGSGSKRAAKGNNVGRPPTTTGQKFNANEKMEAHSSSSSSHNPSSKSLVKPKTDTPTIPPVDFQLAHPQKNQSGSPPQTSNVTRSQNDEREVQKNAGTNLPKTAASRVTGKSDSESSSSSSDQSSNAEREAWRPLTMRLQKARALSSPQQTNSESSSGPSARTPPKGMQAEAPSAKGGSTPNKSPSLQKNKTAEPPATKPQTSPRKGIRNEPSSSERNPPAPIPTFIETSIPLDPDERKSFSKESVKQLKEEEKQKIQETAAPSQIPQQNELRTDSPRIIASGPGDGTAHEDNLPQGSKFMSIAMDGEIKSGRSDDVEKELLTQRPSSTVDNAGWSFRRPYDKQKPSDEGSEERWLPPAPPALTNFGNEGRASFNSGPLKHDKVVKQEQQKDEVLSRSIPARIQVQPTMRELSQPKLTQSSPEAAAGTFQENRIARPVQMRIKKADTMPPPVEIIEVHPPADDESSLGSMGWLFAAPPQKSKVSSAQSTPQGATPPKIDEHAQNESPKNGRQNETKKLENIQEVPEMSPRERTPADLHRSGSPSNQRSNLPILDEQRMESVADMRQTKTNSNVRSDGDAVFHNVDQKLDNTTAKIRPDTHKADDYYKSWILPGAEGPRAKTFDHGDRQDPPGANVSRIFSPEQSKNTNPIDQPIRASATWVASTAQIQDEPEKEWESWVPTDTLTGTRKALQSKQPASSLPMRSDSSFGSGWAPPVKETQGNAGNSIESTHGSKKSPLTGSDSDGTKSSSWGWFPPSVSRRIDHAGRVNPEQPVEATPAMGIEFASKPWAVPPMEDVSSESSRSSTPSQQNEEENRFGDPNPFGADVVVEEVSDSPSGSEYSPSSEVGSNHDSSGSRSQSSSASRSGSRSGSASRVGSGSESSSGSPSEESEYSSEESSQPVNTSRSQQPAVPGRSIMKDINFAAPPPSSSSRPIPQAPPLGGDNESDSEKENSDTDETVACKVPKCCMFVGIPLFVAGIALAIIFILNRDGQNADILESPPSTVPPTMPPTKNGSDLLSLILSFSPGSDDALTLPSSPQSLALEWLSNNQFLDEYSRMQKLQRFAMAVLFFSSDGADWTKNDLWLSDIEECNWYTSETNNPVCDQQEQLGEIDLRNNGLQGTIPWKELSILGSQLLILQVHGNDMSGPIRTDIGNLAVLEMLTLNDNSYTGTIPTEIGRLANVRYFDLSNNLLIGTLPTEISRMTALRSLVLTDNSLSGTIPPQLGNLPNLRNLYLAGNNFVGSVPGSICNLGLENLEVDCDFVTCDCCTSCGSGSPGSPPVSPPVNTPGPDDALYQFIVGLFPSTENALQDATSPQSSALAWLASSVNDSINDRRLRQRYSLATLYFSTSGDSWAKNDRWLTENDECTWFSSTTTPTGPCDVNGNYVDMNLRENNLNGELPPEIAILSSTLITLRLEGNSLTGSIPTVISGLSNLEELNLGNNEMFGVIPSQLGTMASIQRIVLYDNNFFSTIPTELGQLSQLELLDLGSNQLTGAIPTTLGNIEELAGLSVFNNFLSGTLPVQLSGLSNLQLIYIDDNDIVGPIPSDLCNLDFEEFWSDCEETQCLCCTTCCNDGFGCS